MRTPSSSVPFEHYLEVGSHFLPSASSGGWAHSSRLCISGLDRSKLFRKLGHDRLCLSRLALCRTYSCFDSHSVIFHAEMERQTGKTTSIELACTAHISSSTNDCWFPVSLNNHYRRLRAIKNGPTPCGADLLRRSQRGAKYQIGLWFTIL